MTWEPIWALPNIDLDESVNSETFALVSPADPRVQELVQQHRNFGTFLNQFNDTHNNSIVPTLIIRRTDVPEPLNLLDAAASFRDLIVASTVPLARARDIIHDNAIDRLRYSSFLSTYPWMIDRNYEHIIAHTPAVLALHNVDQFTGHSSPELSRCSLRRRDFDEPLLQELLRRWTARYLSAQPEWSDVALFRSLNMVNQACLIPAGADAVLHDFGRTIALWSAAFEILVHPGTSGQTNVNKVFELLENVPWTNRKLGFRHYRIDYRRQTVRKNLGCWLYHRIHLCRNAFMHGNPVKTSTLQVPKSRRPLFDHAAVLYRLALTSFLRLAWKEPAPDCDNAVALHEYAARNWEFQEPQRNLENALQLCRIAVEQQRRDRERQINEVRRRGRAVA